jgi:hypothetical protein
MGSFSAGYDVRYLWDVYADYGDFSWGGDIGPAPADSVTKSVIDTLVSKLSQIKVRPVFTPIDASFKTTKVVRDVQRFFDNYFEIQEVKKKMRRVTLSSAIFGRAFLWVNHWTKSIELLRPWEVGTIGAEFNDGIKSVSKLLVQIDYCPKTRIRKLVPQLKDHQFGDIKADLGIFFDVEHQTITVYLNRQQVLQEKMQDWKSVPFVCYDFYDPITGNRSFGVVDQLRSIQKEINFLNDDFHNVIHRSQMVTVITDSAGPVRKKDIAGESIAVYEVPGGQQAFSTQYGRMPDSSYIEWLEKLENRAYERVGISQLSAMAHKPTGLNSGVAIQTMEDIESDRFQQQVDYLVDLWTDLAICMIDHLPENAELLNDEKTTWKDVLTTRQNYNLQFTGADLLSRDPSTKVQQIVMLAQQGFIPLSKVSSLMELPDLETAFSFSYNVYDAVDKKIEEAIYEENYEIPDFISFETLAQEIVQLQNKLYSSDKEEDLITLDRLNKLDAALLEIMAEDGVIITSPGVAPGQAASSAQNQQVQQNVQQVDPNANPMQGQQQ